MSNGEWKVRREEFQGYMKAKIEAIDDNFKTHSKDIRHLHDRQDKLEKEVTTIKIRIATWVTVIGVFAAAGFEAVKAFIQSIIGK